MLLMKVRLYKFKMINFNTLILHKIPKNLANKKILQIVLVDQVKKIINAIME
jgi:hypothetical protein